MLPYNLIHYAPQYPRQIDWYAILFYIQHIFNIFNVIMDDDYWLIYIYIYIFINRYRRLGKQQWLSVKTSMG
jgi:hypothetical protein